MSREIVQSVLDKYPNLLVIESDRLQERRVQFIPHIVTALNLIGKTSKWGYLIKTGGKVQDDIVVDKVTLHHYDCMTGVEEGKDKYRIKAVWVNHGIIPGKWKWGKIGEHTVPPLPEDEYPEDPPVDPPDEPNPNPDLEARIANLENDVERILSLLNRMGDVFR